MSGINFLKYTLFVTLLILGGAQSSIAGHTPEIKKQDWSFQGPFGSFDRAALQRGFQVYKEVCASCHSMKLLSYRNLEALYEGNPNKKEIVKAIAREYSVKEINDEGEEIEIPARPWDHFVPPYPNDKAARAANNGSLPPDLSLITKARLNGADYIYALLVGYGTAPKNVFVSEGMHYNSVFPGFQIAMQPPLTEGLVTYKEGQPEATVEQMARDVTTFLAWAAEPELESRKQTGFGFLIFLGFLTLFLYLCMRRIWGRLK